MTLHRPLRFALGAILACGVAAPALAVTTDFNSNTLPAGWTNNGGTLVNLTSDGYMLLDEVGTPDTLTYSFTLGTTSDVSFSFWYGAFSTAASNVFTVGLTGQTAQGYTRTNAGGNAAAFISQGVAFAFMNPGASSASGLNAQATQSFSGLLAGNYDIVFQMRNGNARLAKIDDFSMTVTAAPVPEPETYALMLGGLAVVGAVARRRRNAA